MEEISWNTPGAVTSRDASGAGTWTFQAYSFIQIVVTWDGYASESNIIKLTEINSLAAIHTDIKFVAR